MALHAARLLALFVLGHADLGALLGCLGPLLLVGWWAWGEVSGAVRDGVGCIFLFFMFVSGGLGGGVPVSGWSESEAGWLARWVALHFALAHRSREPAAGVGVRLAAFVWD